MSSYVEDHLETLLELRKLNIERRNYVLLSCGANLIYAFCELFLNIIKHSNPGNLNDKATIRLIRKYYILIGQMISPRNSVKMKKQLLLKHRDFQNLALTQAVGGFMFFKNNNR